MEVLRHRRETRPNRPLTMGVLLFDGHHLLNVYGCLDLWGNVRLQLGPQHSLRFVTLGLTTHASNKMVQSQNGPTTLVDYAISLTDPEKNDGDHDDDNDDSDKVNGTNETDSELEVKLPDFDILLVPGGPGITQVLKCKHPAWREKLRQIILSTPVVYSTAHGSLLLAELGPGILPPRPHPVTTCLLFYEQAREQYPRFHWDELARWTHYSHFPGSDLYTAGGASAALDLTHHLMDALFGPAVAQRAVELAEYRPDLRAQYDAMRTFGGPLTRHIRDPTSHPVFHVCAVLFDEYQMMDLMGPVKMLASANQALGYSAFCVTYVGEFRTLVARHGLQFRVHHTLDEILQHNQTQMFDLLLVPGGSGRVREVNNPKMWKALKSLDTRCRQVMSVGKGALLLASTGLLDWKLATSNKQIFHQLSWYGPNTTWKPHARWVVDGKYWTSSGRSAGMDLMLHWISVVRNEETAQAAAQHAEYVWNNTNPELDPFGPPDPPAWWLYLYQRLMFWVVQVFYTIGLQVLGFKMRFVSTSILRQ